MSREHDFSGKIKNKILRLSGHCCAKPDCRRPIDTIISKTAKKPSGFGEIAHIYDASSTKKLRPLPKHLNEIFLSSEENATLLCAVCHTNIDYDKYIDLYPAEVLFSWKDEIETIVRRFLNKVKKEYKKLSQIEKMMLQSEIQASKRQLPDISNLTQKEVVFESLKNAMHRVIFSFNANDISKINRYEKINFNVNKVNFGYLDKKIKEYIDNFTLIRYELRDLLILSKNNKKFNKIIENCVFTIENGVYIIKKSLFDEKSELHNIVIITYKIDQKKSKSDFEIFINLEKLKSNKINLKVSNSIEELNDFIDLLVKDEIIIKEKTGDNPWKVIHDYDYKEFVKNDIVSHLNFLATFSHLAKTENINIYVDQELYESNKILLADTKFYYNLLVNNKISDYFIIDITKTVGWEFSRFNKIGNLREFMNEDLSYIMKSIYKDDNFNFTNHIVKEFEFEFLIKNLKVKIKLENILLFSDHEVNLMWGLKTDNSKIYTLIERV